MRISLFESGVSEVNCLQLEKVEYCSPSPRKQLRSNVRICFWHWLGFVVVVVVLFAFNKSVFLVSVLPLLF